LLALCTLSYQLKRLCYSNKDGSLKTQHNRRHMLVLFASQLKQGGYKLPKANSLKPKHITHLVERWQQEGLTTATIKNRVSALRWWSVKINKASIIPRDNKELGIGTRQRSRNKAKPLDLAKVSRLPCAKMQMALKLQASFGLRLEESLYFQPSIADKGDHIKLNKNWTKGGKARTIPVITDQQRQLLNEAKALAGSNSMIPTHKKFIQGKKALENQALKIGITNMHAHRHFYAQQRYNQLTGLNCPYQGGKKPATAEAQHLDKWARAIISQELGHNRLSITRVYLG
jgi:site-specific recombinase XerC